MAHYAELDENNIVKRVIVVDNNDEPTEAAGIAFCQKLFGGDWVKTSYNTRANVHYGHDSSPDGKPPFRGNYAGTGYFYDSGNDVFIMPKPFPSWNLNTSTWQWDSPVPYPYTPGSATDYYVWNEYSKSWIFWAK